MSTAQGSHSDSPPCQGTLPRCQLPSKLSSSVLLLQDGWGGFGRSESPPTLHTLSAQLLGLLVCAPSQPHLAQAQQVSARLAEADYLEAQLAAA